MKASSSVIRACRRCKDIFTNHHLMKQLMNKLWRCLSSSSWLCPGLLMKVKSQDKTTIIKHVQISTYFFLVPVWRFQHFKYILQNPKLKQMATCFSNHSLDLYLSKSMGSYESEISRIFFKLNILTSSLQDDIFMYWRM